MVEPGGIALAGRGLAELGLFAPSKCAQAHLEPRRSAPARFADEGCNPRSHKMKKPTPLG
jgi:hypothetical protein